MVEFYAVLCCFVFAGLSSLRQHVVSNHHDYVLLFVDPLECCPRDFSSNDGRLWIFLGVYHRGGSRTLGSYDFVRDLGT